MAWLNDARSRRHARLFDLAVKLARGGLGIAAGVAARRLWQRVVAGRTS